MYYFMYLYVLTEKVKSERITVRKLNVESLKGKWNEVTDLVHRRRIYILCMQETGWEENKSMDLKMSW